MLLGYSGEVPASQSRRPSDGHGGDRDSLHSSAHGVRGTREY